MIVSLAPDLRRKGLSLPKALSGVLLGEHFAERVLFALGLTAHEARVVASRSDASQHAHGAFSFDLKTRPPTAPQAIHTELESYRGDKDRPEEGIFHGTFRIDRSQPLAKTLRDANRALRSLCNAVGQPEIAKFRLHPALLNRDITVYALYRQPGWTIPATQSQLTHMHLPGLEKYAQSRRSESSGAIGTYEVLNTSRTLELKAISRGIVFRVRRLIDYAKRDPRIDHNSRHISHLVMVAMVEELKFMMALEAELANRH